MTSEGEKNGCHSLSQQQQQKTSRRNLHLWDHLACSSEFTGREFLSPVRDACTTERKVHRVLVLAASSRCCAAVRETQSATYGTEQTDRPKAMRRERGGFFPSSRSEKAANLDVFSTANRACTTCPQGLRVRVSSGFLPRGSSPICVQPRNSRRICADHHKHGGTLFSKNTPLILPDENSS